MAMGGHGAMDMGPRPPSVYEVLAGTAPPSDQPQPKRSTPDADRVTCRSTTTVKQQHAD